MGRILKRVFKFCVGTALFMAGLLLVLLLYNTRTPADSDLNAPWITNVEPTPWDSPRRLTFVTYNVHDLYRVSADRRLRLEAIGEALAKLDPDVVGIQEAFIASDRAALMTKLADSRLQHAHYFPSGTVGSGLLVLSAYPIEAVAFHRYIRNGKWYKVWHGDWWAGKGAAYVRVAVGPRQYLDFYDTHAHAGYGSDEYNADRAHQMEELAAFVEATHIPDTPAILVGDLNCRRTDPDFDGLYETMALQSLNDNLDGIDHIFAFGNDPYGVSRVQVDIMDGTVATENGAVAWSDHRGYSVQAEFTPRSDDQEDVK